MIPSSILRSSVNTAYVCLLIHRENDESVKEEKSDLKEKSTGNKKTNRFHPYSKDKNSGTGEKKGPNRNRVFISNIPYDMKWQAIKDLMREKGNSCCRACCCDLCVGRGGTKQTSNSS